MSATPESIEFRRQPGRGAGWRAALVAAIVLGAAAGGAQAQRNRYSMPDQPGSLEAAAAAGGDRNPQAVGQTFGMHGEIETVTRNAVGVRGSDGSIYEVLLPANPALGSQALVKAYHVGDEVDLEAMFIDPQYVDADNRSYALVLRQLKLRKRGSGGTLRKALASPAWRAAGNLLQPPAGTPNTPAVAAPPPDDAFLAAARQAVLGYLAQLPNFLVSESVNRDTRYMATEDTDHIDSELTVIKGHEYRNKIRYNGAAWNQPFAQLPGLHWTNDFADRLVPIFQRACGAVLQSAGQGERDGQPVAIYNFRLPPSQCAGSSVAGAVLVYPGFVGKVYISAASHLVLRLEESFTQLPGSFAQSGFQDATNWAPVTVAGGQWLMPESAQMITRFRDGRQITISVSYKNYRRFGTTSTFSVVKPSQK